MYVRNALFLCGLTSTCLCGCLERNTQPYSPPFECCACASSSEATAADGPAPVDSPPMPTKKYKGYPDLSIVDRTTHLLPDFDTGRREEAEAVALGKRIVLGTWTGGEGEAITFREDGSMTRVHPPPLPFAFVPPCVQEGRWRWHVKDRHRPPVLIVETKPTYCACRMFNVDEVPSSDCRQRIEGTRERYRVIAPNVDTVYLEPNIDYTPECLCRTKDCTCTEYGRVSLVVWRGDQGEAADGGADGTNGANDQSHPSTASSP
jgi:hypothetical protein